MTILRRAYVPTYDEPRYRRLSKSNACLPNNENRRNAGNPNRTKNNIKFHVRSYDDRYDLILALPGYSREDIQIELSKGILSIEVLKSEKEEKESLNWDELNYAGQKAKFYFPEDADHEKIHASMNNGILTVSMHKLPEAIPQPPKEITVK